MFGLPLRKRYWPIALDMGSDSIKMLQMHRVGQIVSVCACGRWRFPESVSGDPAAARELAVAAVHDMLHNGNFRGHRVISCLSSGQLSIKNIRLPHMPEHELGQAVMWEAKERFSFDITTDQLAYLNAGRIRQGGEVRDEIIMLATPGEAVQDHLTLLDEMGLSAEHIDAEPIALFRVFERFLRRRDDEQAVSVVIDIGLGSTRVVVARGRQVVFVKSIDIGGRKFIEAVAKRLNITKEEAAELRMRVMREYDPRAEQVESSTEEEQSDQSKPKPLDGNEQSDSVRWTLRDAIRGDVEALAREISLCLRYCSVTFRGLRPKHITVTGGEAYDPDLLELLGDNLTMQCAVGRPLRGIDVSAVDLGADRRGMLNEWAVCAGLALRDVEMKSSTHEAEYEQDRLSA